MKGMAVTLAAGAVLMATGAGAAPPDVPFASIDGGELRLADWAGRPVLVVNTASLCAFTPQYEGLQALYDAYRDRGLVVLAVPSDDFRQELNSASAVRDFCAVNFDLDLPMTDITKVKGAAAHPFYQWVKAETGFAPGWNFAKVLVDGSGRVAGTFGSSVQPLGSRMRAAVEAVLN
ncbi:MAG: glutathione peroxidase [Gemmobacter sp.]